MCFLPKRISINTLLLLLRTGSYYIRVGLVSLIIRLVSVNIDNVIPTLVTTLVKV